MRDFPLKLSVQGAPEGEVHAIQDFGSHSAEFMDGPDYPAQVAAAVASGQTPFRILVRGSVSARPAPARPVLSSAPPPSAALPTPA